MGYCCTTAVYSQPTEEALLKALETTPKVDHDSIYYELFKVMIPTRPVDLLKVKFYASRSLANADKQGHLARYAKACRAIAHCYKQEFQYDSARYYYYLGINRSRQTDSKNVLMSLMIDLGTLYDKSDKYDSALKYYYSALEIADELGRDDGRAAISNDIGLIYHYLNNYEKALEYFQNTLLIKRASGIPDEIPSNLINMAIILTEQGKFDEAFSTLDEAENICQNNCDINIEARLAYCLGNLFQKKKDFDKSLPSFIKSYDLAKKGNIKEVLAYTPFHLSELRFREGDYIGAIDYLNESERVANEVNLKRLKRDIYEAYAKIYNELGDFENVAVYQTKFNQLKDSIFNSNVAFNLSALQLESQKKQSDLILQQKEVQLSRSRWIIAFVVVVTLLLLVVSVLLYHRYRLNRRLKQILKRQVQLRTGDLIQNNAELRQLNMEFDLLLRQTSKYIRGPLATLMGLIELAERDKGDPQRTQEYLAKIKKVADAMGLSLEQLKEVGKMRRGKDSQKKEGATLDMLLEKHKVV